MRLEAILVHGFKSFAEKTEVKVFPGVTCIVGPNGCGKSNVADAMRWALGEQSPKTLRGNKMEDVIFHGSASRKMVGMAEVSLVFNNDGGLNVPWSEVAVARRLYRTGESEYLLNTNVCRLRDVQDLFAGTGVNPKAYALMDQERLNHVLTAKPWERRMFIEEAAGIARYKQQRSETQGKLDATRLNMQRLRDVMEEVRRQLSSIERQARKAQQYKALQSERQGLDLALVAADYATLATQFKEYNLDCVSCHVTGYDQAGGSTVTHAERLKNVQCEVCHGPGSKHAASPKRVEIPTRKPKGDVCLACHHPPHVTEFDAEKKMLEILGPGHGE